MGVAIVFLGADFVDAPLTLLEKMESSAEAVSAAVADTPESVSGIVTVLTCNRAEFYLDAHSPDEALPWLIERIAAATGLTAADVAQVFRVLTGGSVVRHLFAVTSGLESMVVGESEITGQIRRSFADAKDCGLTTSRLNRLFQQAQQVAKNVAGTTGVGRSGRSIIHTALDLVNVGRRDEPAGPALVIGTGAYARVVTTALKKRGVRDIWVYSRSGRAPVFASQHGVEPLTSEQLEWALGQADGVISASGQPGYALTANHLHRALSSRASGRPLWVIDVALSPDVDPVAASLEGCELVTLETLRTHNPVQHREAVMHAERLVEDAAAHFDDNERSRRVDPLITSLRAAIDAQVDSELGHARRTLSADQAREVERVVRRITRSILHTPTVRARDLAKEGREDEYAQALSLLFDLEAQKS